MMSTQPVRLEFNSLLDEMDEHKLIGLRTKFAFAVKDQLNVGSMIQADQREVVDIANAMTNQPFDHDTLFDFVSDYAGKSGLSVSKTGREETVYGEPATVWEVTRS